MSKILPIRIYLLTVIKGYEYDRRVMKTTAQKIQRGFTLIELLVVIAVIGVLAAIVLLAVNPTEQLARGRDANRISSIEGL
ncbi:MAG TPA: prepilin-type N-terminal cleavage/methylation domain-containing protein, partial [Patescibacteria group bacterium]|nr:prepilin-type N-terminal cleavage/methylation domain-containing protein [Patescibacteria group bacterium]